MILNRKDFGAAHSDCNIVEMKVEFAVVVPETEVRQYSEWS
jgi:hypothetical protein